MIKYVTWNLNFSEEMTMLSPIQNEIFPTLSFYLISLWFQKARIQI